MGTSSRAAGVAAGEESTLWQQRYGDDFVSHVLSRWNDRGQSEVIGIILLVSVVIVLVTLAGVIVIGDWQSTADEETPRISVESDLESTELTIRHQGGDSLPAGDVQVLLEGDTNRAYSLEEFDGPGELFEPGTVWRQDFSDDPLDGTVELLVLHRDSGTILHETTHEVTAPVRATLESPPDAVDVGDEILVDYRVENTRMEAVETTLEFEVEGVVQDSTTLDLDAGEAQTGQFSYDTTQADAPAVEIAVATPDSRDSATVDVVAPSYFEVTTIDGPAAVTEYETIEIEYTVENTGTETATQTIRFEVDGDKVTTHDDVTLAGGETYTDTFTYETSAGDRSDITATVVTEDDSAAVLIAVEDGTPGASDLLAILENDEQVFEGDAFQTHLTYRNPSDATETVTLVTYGDGTVPDSTTIELDPGEETTPETLGFPEEGTVVDVTDDPDEPAVYVEIDEPE